MGIWIVEMWNDATGVARWEPTVGVSITRQDGRLILKKWQANNPTDRFRLQRYERAQEAP